MSDDELLARLRAVDPARTSDAPPPDIDRLLEAIMTTDTATPTKNGTANRHRRLPLLLAGAAAALLTVGGGITWKVTQSDDTPPAAAVAPLALTVQKSDVMAGCAEIDVATLRGYTTAFEGTATSVMGDRVVLRVDRWYRGGGTSTVHLTNDQEGMLESAGQKFAVGQTYLVYAKDGKIPACYGEAEATPELRDLYDQAYRP